MQICFFPVDLSKWKYTGSLVLVLPQKKPSGVECAHKPHSTIRRPTRRISEAAERARSGSGLAKNGLDNLTLNGVLLLRP